VGRPRPDPATLWPDPARLAAGVAAD